MVFCQVLYGLLYCHALTALYICTFVCAVAYRGKREPMFPCMLQESRQACVWVRRTQLWYQLWPGEGEMQGPHSHPRPQGPMQRSVDTRNFCIKISENNW